MQVFMPILLVILTGVMLLGSPHRWQVSPHVSMAEAARLQGIIGKLTSAMVTEDGKMVEKAEIELTPSEINTLLITGLRAAQHRQKPDLYYDAEWAQGALESFRKKLESPQEAVDEENPEVAPDHSAKIDENGEDDKSGEDE